MIYLQPVKDFLSTNDGAWGGIHPCISNFHFENMNENLVGRLVVVVVTGGGASLCLGRRASPAARQDRQGQPVLGRSSPLLLSFISSITQMRSHHTFLIIFNISNTHLTAHHQIITSYHQLYLIPLLSLREEPDVSRITLFQTDIFSF